MRDLTKEEQTSIDRAVRALEALTPRALLEFADIFYDISDPELPQESWECAAEGIEIEHPIGKVIEVQCALDLPSIFLRKILNEEECSDWECVHDSSSRS